MNLRPIGRGLVALALVLLPTLAHAQGQPAFASGTLLPGHLLKAIGTGGQHMDVGNLNGDVNGRGVSPFSIADALGPGVCSNTAPTGGQHYSFCIGHDSDGNALLQVTANGGATEKSCKITINGTEYACIGGGGNVSGPVSSTSNDFAAWNGTAGNALKNGAGLLIGHAGGLTTTDTTSPTSFTADLNPGFSSYVWKTPNLRQLDDASSHPGEVHATMGIVNKSTGSGNGPTQNDLALVLGCQKRDWLTTAVVGEQDCMFAHVDQGAKGDSAVYLASNSHVDDPSLPNYGVTVYEAASFLVAPTSGVITRSNRPVLGYGITGFQNVTAVAAGAGGTCRLTLYNTGYLNVAIGVTVTGIKGAPECNGFWGASVVDGTHIDLTNSVLVGSYTSGGTAGTPIGSIGGPTFGVMARAQTGQNGTAFLASQEQGFVGSWGSPFKGILYNDNQVYFDMDDAGRMVLQPPGTGSLVDPNYALSLLSGGLRLGGTQTTIPRDNPQGAALSTYPGGSALTFNYCSENATPAPGCGAAEIWGLTTGGSSSFSVYQKTSAVAATRVFNASLNGSTFKSALDVTGTVLLLSGTAIPAGGSTGAGMRFSSVANYGVFFGSGAPTLAAAKGSLYLRSDGSSTSTRLYVNSDGGTTWVAITTAS